MCSTVRAKGGEARSTGSIIDDVVDDPVLGVDDEQLGARQDVSVGPHSPYATRRLARQAAERDRPGHRLADFGSKPERIPCFLSFCLSDNSQDNALLRVAQDKPMFLGKRQKPVVVRHPPVSGCGGGTAGKDKGKPKHPYS